MRPESYDPGNDTTCSKAPKNVDMDGIAVAVAIQPNPAVCARPRDPNSMPRMLDVVVHWCLRAF